MTALVRAALLSRRMPGLNQNAFKHVHACTAGVCSPCCLGVAVAIVQNLLGSSNTLHIRLVRALCGACRLERTKQFAVRAVRLPESADPERINASYENGVLTVKARGPPAGLLRRRCKD